MIVMRIFCRVDRRMDVHFMMLFVHLFVVSG